MDNDRDWVGPLTADLDELAAYDAMLHFLETFWTGYFGKDSGDLAILLGMFNRELWSDGMPADPGCWPDWLRSVEAVRARRQK